MTLDRINQDYKNAVKTLQRSTEALDRLKRKVSEDGKSYSFEYNERHWYHPQQGLEFILNTAIRPLIGHFLHDAYGTMLPSELLPKFDPMKLLDGIKEASREEQGTKIQALREAIERQTDGYSDFVGRSISYCESLMGASQEDGSSLISGASRIRAESIMGNLRDIHAALDAIMRLPEAVEASLNVQETADISQKHRVSPKRGGKVR